MRLKITESQLNKLKENIGDSSSDKYLRNIKTSFNNISDLTYNGFEVNYIDDVTVPVKFDIDIEYRKWGINDINIVNIGGDDKIELNINYYGDGEEEIEVVVSINIDWDKVEKNIVASKNVVTIDDLELYLGNDDNGNIIITNGSINLYK